MKKNIGFGLLVFFTLLTCFLFAQQAAYHVVSIFLIVPSVVAVIFYRRRGLVYAALILLAALMIPVFINKDPLAIAESVAICDCFLSMAMKAASSVLFRIRLARSASIASQRFIHCGNAFA